MMFPQYGDKTSTRRGYFYGGHAALTELHGDSDAPRDVILVVDDEFAIRELIKAMVGVILPEFEVIEAANPDEAVKHLSGETAKRIALVCTDNTMPKMTGVQLVGIVRGEEVEGKTLPEESVESLRKVPISLISGDYDLSEARFLMENGALQSVIKKPFLLEDLSLGIAAAIYKLVDNPSKN